jgi:hypothetical protein
MSATCKIDPFATQRRCHLHGRNLATGARELFDGFDQRRALQRLLSRLAPQAYGLLNQAASVQ